MLSISIVKTECDLELSKFIAVAPMCLFLAPRFNKFKVSAELVTNSSFRPSTYTPLFKSSLIHKLPLAVLNFIIFLISFFLFKFD